MKKNDERRSAEESNKLRAYFDSLEPAQAKKGAVLAANRPKEPEEERRD